VQMVRGIPIHAGQISFLGLQGLLWRSQWVPKFLDVRMEEHEVFAEYIIAIGSRVKYEEDLTEVVGTYVQMLPFSRSYQCK